MLNIQAMRQKLQNDLLRQFIVKDGSLENKKKEFLESFVGIRSRFGLNNEKLNKFFVKNEADLMPKPRDIIQRAKSRLTANLKFKKNPSEITKEIEADFHNLPSHITEIVAMKETSNPLEWIMEKRPENVRQETMGSRIKIPKKILRDHPVEFSILKETFFYLNEEEDVPIFREISTFSRDVLNPVYIIQSRLIKGKAGKTNRKSLRT